MSACVGCAKLFETVRRDQGTCSPTCRVKAHRTGTLKKRRAVADQAKVDVGLMGRCDALCMLRPDLADKVMAGAASLDDVNPIALAAFDDLALQAARMVAEGVE